MVGLNATLVEVMIVTWVEERIVTWVEEIGFYHLGGGEEERQSLARPSSHLPSTVSKAVNEADLGVGVMLGVFSRLNPDPNPDPDAASGSLSCLLASASIAFFLLLLLPGRLLCCTTFSSPP